MGQTLRRYGRLIEPGVRRSWVLVTIFAVVVSALEACAALLVFFLISNITTPSKALDVPVIGDLHHRFPGMSDGRLFGIVAIAMAMFFLVRSAMTVTQSYLQYRLVHHAGAALSTKLFRSYLRAPYAFHLRRNSSELIRNSYESVIQIVGHVFAPVVVIGSEGLMVLAMFIVLLVKAAVPTLFAVVILGPVVLVLLRVMQPRLRAIGKVNEDAVKQTFELLQQSLGGIRDIKVLGREDFFTSKFARTRSTQAQAVAVHYTFVDIPRVVVETVVILLILAFLAVTRATSGSTTGTLAVLGLFAYAVLRVMPALHRIVVNINQLRYGDASVNNVLGDLDLSDLCRGDLASHQREADCFRDELAVEHVSYRYPATDRDVLENICLSIRAGESIGIVGPTGGGKTTLVDVIIGLLEPTGGRVTVDGDDIGSVLRVWQRCLGVVSQSPFLLDDSLRRNIALGLEDDEIDEVAVRDAVNLAQLNEFVSSLPSGLDTPVGERGVRVSGGQRQRVAIARALYRRPSVLIFDEGTSALDNITEAELIRALDRLHGDRTIITIAHRLTTVRNCDRIALVRNGRVEDIGSYRELLDRNAEFREMAGGAVSTS